MRNRLLPLLFVLAAAAITTAAHGVTEIRRSVIACGGLGSVASVHSVRSTLGQTVVGRVSGAIHAMSGGYWSELETPSGVNGPAIPTAFALTPLSPNPARSPVGVRFEVPARGGIVHLRIYDVTGRKVRTLHDGFAMPGIQSISWDGRDEEGNRVALGIYVLAMDASGYTANRKLVLIR